MILNGAIIRSKVRTPAVADAVIGRERVVAELAREASGRPILRVVAPPGSGKTAAVIQFVSCRSGPRAWFSLGEADERPQLVRLGHRLARPIPARPRRAPLLDHRHRVSPPLRPDGGPPGL